MSTSMRPCVTISLVPEARGGPFVFWDDLDEALREARECGFPAVELFAPDASPLQQADLKSKLRDHDLELAAVGTGAGWVRHGWTLSSPEDSVRIQGSDFVKSLIEAAAPFGAAVIIGSMQGKSPSPGERADALGRLRDSVAPLAEMAEKSGVSLLIEPLNRYETNLLNTLAQGVVFVDSLKPSKLRLLADLFHMNIEETDCAAAFRAAGDAVGHVHFVDSNRRAAGFGHLKFPPVVEALREIGYDGYLSAEAIPLPSPREAASQTMRAFQQYVEQPSA